MRGRMGRLLTIVILAAGLATTSPFVAHADGSTEVRSRHRHRQPQQLHRQRSRRSRRVRHDQSDRPPRRALRVDSAGCVHLRNTRRPLVIATPTDWVRPQRARSFRTGNCFTTLHGPVTPGAQCSRQRRVVCRQRADGDVQPLVLADERRARSTRPADDLLRRDGRTSSDLVQRHRRTRRRVGCPLQRGHVRPHLVRARPASAGDVIYGSAVESDDGFSYLFGWSYDQFNLPDPSSPPPSQLFVARVPLGRFDLQPTYWSGSAWVTNRARAVPIDTQREQHDQPDAAAVDRRDVALGGEGQRLEWHRRSPRRRRRTSGTVDHAANRHRSHAHSRRAHQHVCGTPHAVAVRHREPRRCAVEQRVADGSAGVRQPHPVSAAALRIDAHRLRFPRRRSRRPPSRWASCRRALPFERSTHARGTRWRRGQVLRVPLAGLVAAGPRRGDRPRRSRSRWQRISHRVVVRRSRCRRRRTSTMSPALRGRRTRW